MGKRSGLGGLIGAAALAVGAAAVVKYLKDYTNFKEAAKADIHELEGSADEVKEAARRTYTSISTGKKEDLKAAATDLAKAAGAVTADAGNLAKTAGKTAVQHVKDMKAKYDVDPEAAKSEVIGNLRDMASDVTQKVSDVSSKVSEKLKPEEVRSAVENVKDSISETVTDIKEEFAKNLEEEEQAAKEQEAAAKEKEAEAQKKTEDALREEAEKHETRIEESL